MSSEHAECSKGKLKHFPQQVHAKCQGCKELSGKFVAYKDAAEKQHCTLVRILAEHKLLLDRIIAQTTVTENMLNIFPITTEDKLKEFDNILQRQPGPFMQQIRQLLGDSVERNFHKIFGHDIIMNFNVDGSFGKKRLKVYGNVYTAVIDVISTFDESADKVLRAAFQRQKKKFFKQTSRNKAKNNKDDDFSEQEYII